MPKRRQQRYWCGFIDDMPAFETTIDGYSECKQLTVFRSRAEARKRYEDVREVVLPVGKPGSESK